MLSGLVDMKNWVLMTGRRPDAMPAELDRNRDADILALKEGVEKGVLSTSTHASRKRCIR